MATAFNRNKAEPASGASAHTAASTSTDTPADAAERILARTTTAHNTAERILVRRLAPHIFIFIAVALLYALLPSFIVSDVIGLSVVILNACALYARLRALLRTERREAQRATEGAETLAQAQALRYAELEKILAAIEANTTDGLILVNTDERILRVNAQVLRIFGLSDNCEYPKGQRLVPVFRSTELSAIFDELIAGADVAAGERVWETSANTEMGTGAQGAERARETSTKTDQQGASTLAGAEQRSTKEHNAVLRRMSIVRGGTQRSVDVQARLVSVGSGLGRGAGAHVLFVVKDVSELLYLEQVRKEFVANVSHELKTPITVIQGFAETLLDSALSDAESARNFVGIIMEQSLRMKDIVYNLLTLSELEQSIEKTGLPTEAVNITRLIQKCIALIKHRFNTSDLPLQVRVEGREEVRLNAGLFEQVFINLFDNAIRHGGGDIRMYVDVFGGAEHMSIVLRDTGRGIPKRFLPHVFERLYRVGFAKRAQGSGKGSGSGLGGGNGKGGSGSGSTSGLGGGSGSGIGLAIVKHIVSAHKGSIAVQSRVGEGTAFSIRIPMENETSEAEARE